MEPQFPFRVYKIPESLGSFTFVNNVDLALKKGVEETLGLAWSRGFPSELHPPVWTLFRQMWSSLTIELTCRHVEELHKLLRFHKTDIEIILEGKTVSPDFFLDGEVYEFKTHIGTVTEEEEEKEIRECKRKYKGVPINLYFITADQKFPDRLKLGTEERRYYMKRYIQYVTYLHEHKDAFLEHKKAVRGIQVPADMLFDSFEFKSSFKYDANRLRDYDYSSQKKEILRSQTEMKKFLDKNLMSLETMPEFICPALQKVYDYNISSERPFDRDYNKAKFGTVYGHKSRAILPYLQGFIQESEETLLYFAEKEGEFSSLIKTYQRYSDLLPVIRSLKTLLAQASSESNVETFKLIESACGSPVHNITTARRAIDGEILKQQALFEAKHGISEDADWKLSKRGTFKSKNLNLLKQFHIDTKTNDDFGTKTGTDMCDVDTDILVNWLEELEGLPEVPFPKIRLDTAYPFDTQSTGLLNLIGKDGLEVVQRIWKRPVSKQLLLSSFWMRALLMAVPVTDIKRGSTRESVIFYTKETGTLTMCTLHPNEITTGLMTIWQTMSDEKFKSLMNKPLGTWVRIGSYSSSDKLFHVVQAQPFRLNLKFVEQFDSVIGSYLGLHVLYNGMKGRELHNPLMESMFLDYSRQLTRAAEFVYVASARGAASLCFGQVEGKNKFEKLKGKDPRVSLLLRNCKEGWKGFREAVKEMNRTGSWVSFKDPFFGITIDNLMEFQFVEYFKQVFVKDDGFDDKKLAAGFFADDCADKQAYNSSPFNPKVNPECWYIKTEEMPAYLFKGEKWTPVSFCSEFIKACTADHFEETKNMRRGDFLASLKMSNVTDDIANSKVMMPETSWGETIEIFARSTKADGEKKDEETIKYKGLYSVKLSESVYFTIEEFLTKADEFEAFLNENRRKKGLPGDIQVSRTEEPSAVEICLYLLWKFPNEVLLVPVNKVQTGADKRQFYIQTYNGRTQNSVLDAVFRTYLSASQYDVITKSGDDKLMALSAEISNLKKKSDGIRLFFSSEDQKRFGDSYPLEAFVMKYDALKEVGYMSEGACDFSKHITSTMKERKHLMPWQMSQILDKDIKNKQDAKQNTLSMQTDLQAIQTTMDKFTDLNLHSKEANKKTTDLDRAISENRHLDKDIGFALGVMNIVSTCLTILHLKAACDILRDCFPGVGVFALGHSDDSLKGTDLPLIDDYDFLRARVPFLVECLLDKKKVIFNSRSETFTVITKDDEVNTFKTKEATALFVCLSLYTPRLVGQRPSLFKWYFGSIAEMLQVQSNSDSVVVPALRYAAALFKDLPGKSYATDLTAACSRVLPLIQAGVTAETVVMMQIITTLLVRVRFGIDIERVPEIRYDKHPVLLGGYLCLPTEYIENGFDANVIRLMASAEKNHILKRELTILMLTSSVWSGKTDRNRKDWITTENEMTKADIQKENNQQGVVEMNKEDTLIGDTFVDFFVRFSAKVKTLQSFVRMATAFSGHVLTRFKMIPQSTYEVITSDMEKEPDNKIEENEKALISAIKIVSMANTHNFLYHDIDLDLKFVRMLKTYTTRSFQESYLRVPLGVKTINRLGYLSRIMGNPFNPDIDPVKKPLISIHEAVIAVQGLATSESFEIPEENESMYQLQRLIYDKQITTLLTRTYEFGAVEVNPAVQLKVIERTPYQVVSRNPNNMKFSFLVNETVGLLIEKISLGKADHEVDLYKLEPWLRYNDRFQENFVTIASFIRRLEQTHDIRKALIRNADVLKKLLHGTGQRLVCKVAGVDPIEDMMLNRARIGMKVVLRHATLSAALEVKSIRMDDWKEASGAVVRLMARGIFSPVDPSVFHFMNRNKPVSLDMVTYLNTLLPKRSDFRKSDLNSVVALFCMNGNKGYMDVRQEANWGKGTEASETVSRLILSSPMVSDMLADVEMPEGRKSLIPADITAISSIVLKEGSLLVFHVGETGIVAAVNRVGSQFLKLLIRLAVYMSRNSKLKSKKMHELVLKGRGDYKWSYGEDERRTLVDGSDLKIIRVSDQQMTSAILRVSDKNLSFMRVGEFVTFAGFGTVGIKRTPFIWTPWVVDILPDRLVASSARGDWELDSDLSYINKRLTQAQKMMGEDLQESVAAVIKPLLILKDNVGIGQFARAKLEKALSPFYDATKFAAVTEYERTATGIGERFTATIGVSGAHVSNETRTAGLLRVLFTKSSSEVIEYRRLAVLMAVGKFIQSELCLPFFICDRDALKKLVTVRSGKETKKISILDQLFNCRDKQSALRFVCKKASSLVFEDAQGILSEWVARFLDLSTDLVLEEDENPVALLGNSSEEELAFNIKSKIHSLTDTGSFSSNFADVIWREGLADKVTFLTFMTFNLTLGIPLYRGSYWDRTFSLLILTREIKERLDPILNFY